MYLQGFSLKTPFKSCTKRVSFLHFTLFFGSLPPLSQYIRAAVLSLQFFKIVPPVCPSTCPSTPHFSPILALGSGTRTFPDPPPSNAIRTPFKRGRNRCPTGALSAHLQMIRRNRTKKAARVNVQLLSCKLSAPLLPTKSPSM